MGRKRKASRLDYAQFLFSSQVNFTLTYLADHNDKFSHDAMNRYLLKTKLTPSLLWEHVKPEVIPSSNGYLIFDDKVLDKQDSTSIELTRWQYSGNEGKVIRGIGIVTCIYYNPDIDQFWAIDYRIYAPEHDGKTKITHARDMLHAAIKNKKIAFKTVLMDSWYATTKFMLTIDSLGKTFYCPIKSNRLISHADRNYEYIPVKKFKLSTKELLEGASIHLNKLPKNKHLQLFCITVNTHRSDYIITNGIAQKSSQAVQKEYGFRCIIEQLHRETKQLTGIEKCQCRSQRIQRNHIACSFLVWARMKSLASRTGKTIYKVKENLMTSYLVEQLKCPTMNFNFA